MNTNETRNLLDTLEVIEHSKDLDLFVDELEDHYNNAAACLSTLACISSVNCLCTLTTFCSIWDVPAEGEIVS